MIKNLIFCSLLFGAVHSQAQISNDPSTVPDANEVPDSSKIVDNTFFDIFNGKPGKAAFYGLVAPGGGQIYNKKWWKLPFLLKKILKNYSHLKKQYIKPYPNNQPKFN